MENRSIGGDATTGSAPQNDSIVFYDGECGLCDRIVSFLLEHDPRRRLRFAALQGESARALLPPERIHDLDTVVLIDSRGTHLESSAMLRSLAHLGGFWALTSLFLIVPRLIRDAAYRFVAHRRRTLFGPSDACRLVGAEERERFLP